MSAPEPELFTIGHSNHPIDVFLGLLRRHRIETIADVRSRPYSRFVPHFSQQRLERLLAEAGLGYLFLGAELGGKPPRGEAPAYLDRIAQPEFRAGIDRLLAAAGQRRVAMMCRERDPLDCHRLHLVCRYLGPWSGAIHHILPSGEGEPQQVTERRLLERGGAATLPLFERDQLLDQAYDAWWREAR